ncbi:MAG: hypothetical protein J7L72_03315 [Candidatus Aminicenantes bacterium]|nr:hypothetical protein [Candidatus Aminicenantes bacterium]
MMTYSDVQNVIVRYAPEMAQPFADGFSRFPVGGNAAMIVNYLNEKAQFYYNINKEVAELLAAAASEIIIRSDRR